MDKQKKPYLIYIAQLFGKVNDPGQLYGLLDIFFTDDEKDDLADRVVIVRELLRQKKSQRQIARDKHVSIAKITRGSNALKRAPEKHIHILKKALVDQFDDQMISIDKILD